MYCKYSSWTLLALLMATACGGDEEGNGINGGDTSTGTRGGPPPSGTPASVDDPPDLNPPDTPPAPFERDFEGLVAQTAPWAGLDIRITRAHLFRGERPEELRDVFPYLESSVYAVLDVGITQVVDGETDYADRDTWDLILADGSRERPLNALGVAVVTGDTASARLFYRATEDSRFEGATLEVNGADRTSREPLRIPLDAPAVFESESELASLVGQVVAPTAEGDLSFEILEALYGVNLREQELRAPRDKRLVALNTRVGYSGNFSQSFSAPSDGPKLVVNGNTLPAVEGGIDTIPSGGTIDFSTIYEIDEATTAFDVVFDTGDADLVRLPVALPTAPAVPG